MYITNVHDVVATLRTRLPEYLAQQGIINPGQKKFCCFLHQEDTPSMVLNPKTGYETAHCFGCGEDVDIFAAAEHLEGLPCNGAEWVTATIPHLAEALDVEVQLGEGTGDHEKTKLYKLAQDMSDILSQNPDDGYSSDRGWDNEHEFTASIDEDDLTAQLVEKGWPPQELASSLMIKGSRAHFFGKDKVTFVIKDFRGRPIGFQSRNLELPKPKYINTSETVIYEKRKVLHGINLAIKRSKLNGLYVVEGVGDRARLLALGVLNVVATCGTAFTPEHLAMIKMLGIKDVYFCFDWDAPGYKATLRTLKDTVKGVLGVTCHVVNPPESGEKDVDELLKDQDTAAKFMALTKTPAFDWLLETFDKDTDLAEISVEMVPLIAVEPAAVKREMLIRRLSEKLNVSMQSIDQDVMLQRNGRLAQRRDRLLASVKRYEIEVQEDPDNITSIQAKHEEEVGYIEAEYDKQTIGRDYQLSRFDALQEAREVETNGVNMNTFEMSKFTAFKTALDGGMPWTTGCLIYVGGRGNSGKTATVIALGLDIALSDPDAIVIMHFTDDHYPQVEPRLKTNISQLTAAGSILGIGEAASPHFRITGPAGWAKYNTATQAFRELIAEEKLIVIDSEDGTTLSALEKTVRYVRNRNPYKKILIVCDNTHNYTDFAGMDQTQRITMISNGQKRMTAKYHACMIATAEYRKKGNNADFEKMRLPTDDDLADARALIYRPLAIFHVYNDLNDRTEDGCEIFWTDPSDPETKRPRLMLHFTKNKITSFKDKLMMDLDPDTVTVQQKDTAQAREEARIYMNSGAVAGGETEVQATEWHD